jgi:hypothetical protein
MLEKYEQAIRETFQYLDDYIADPETAPLKIDEAIESHMKIKGFTVYCSYTEDYEIVCVYPKVDNLPIHIWKRRKS